jgi:hypothetical protein
LNDFLEMTPRLNVAIDTIKRQAEGIKRLMLFKNKEVQTGLDRAVV